MNSLSEEEFWASENALVEKAVLQRPEIMAHNIETLKARCEKLEDDVAWLTKLHPVHNLLRQATSKTNKS